MNRRFTLALAAFLGLAPAVVNAQIAVDGTLNANELGSGPGLYQLAGQYTGVHSAANRGLAALYIGATDSTLNIMVVASPEKSDYNAILLYLDAPHASGIPAGTQLGGGDDNSSQFRSRPTLDMPMDYGYRITVAPSGNDNVYLSRIDYTGTPNTDGRYRDTYLGPTNKTGNNLVITDPVSNTVGAHFAYQTGAADVAANGSTGWEFSIPLSTVGGATTGDLFNMMVAYVADNTEFYTDIIPQIPNLSTALGLDPDFTARIGAQYTGFRIGSGPTATRKANAQAPQIQIEGQPVTASSAMLCTIPSGTRQIISEVYNPLGQKVATLVNETHPVAGSRRVGLADVAQLPAGSYVLNTLIGENLFTTHLVVE
ncbi:hypothetical protein WDZ92_00900 [Nostoc sp. NIES-2111]